MADIQSLRDLITTPLIRWHLDAFYEVKFYSRVPNFLTSVDFVAKAAPDGYTMVITSIDNAVQIHLAVREIRALLSEGLITLQEVEVP